MLNPSCVCKDCPCDAEGCDLEECDCESCEATCSNNTHSSAKKRRTTTSVKLYDAIVRKDKSEICKILQWQNVNLRTVYSNGDRALHLVFKTFAEEDIIPILKVFITWFLTKDFNLYFKNKDKETVFHIAVKRKMKKAIDCLLESGFEIEMIYKPSNPVPHYFIDEECKNFLELVERGGSDLNYCDRSNVESDGANFAEWLISKGVDFDRLNRNKESALHSAIKLNLQHLLPTLLKHSKEVKYVNDISKRTLLHSFIVANDAHHVRTARRKVWSVGFGQRYTAEIIKILLDNGVSVDAVDTFGDTALHMAVRTSVQTGIFETLLDRFTNIHHKNKSGRTVLQEVTRAASWTAAGSEAESYLRILRSLITKGADVNTTCKDGLTPLCEAVLTKNLLVIEFLKGNNADFTVTPLGCNLLHLLAKKKPGDISSNEAQEAIFDLLLEEGCNVNAPDNDGETPLHLAVKDQNIIVIEKLIAHGANIDWRENSRQMTPLHFAVEYKKPAEVAELLLSNGANANSKDFQGRRPLDWAAANRDSQVVQVLLKSGAHVHARCFEGETPLSLAILNKNPNNVKELLKYGANINEPCVFYQVDLSHFINRVYVVDPMLEHWVKLEAADLPRLKEYKAIVNRKVYLQAFYEACLEEIEKLKTTFIGDQTTLYKFLKVHPNVRYAYAYCEMLQKYVESPTLEQQFPKYSVLILGNYRAAVARNTLVDKAKKAWLELTDIELPDVCIERILAFFSNPELIDMIEE